MFRYHVLGDSSVPDPGYLPYYPAAFFEIIKYVHLETPLNLLSMSISQWAIYLTKNGLTIESYGTVSNTYHASQNSPPLDQTGSCAGDSPDSLVLEVISSVSTSSC